MAFQVIEGNEIFGHGRDFLIAVKRHELAKHCTNGQQTEHRTSVTVTGLHVLKKKNVIPLLKFILQKLTIACWRKAF